LSIYTAPLSIYHHCTLHFAGIAFKMPPIPSLTGQSITTVAFTAIHLHQVFHAKDTYRAR
ncbi:MAG: hypothetical protein OEV53_06205, partial [Nitrospira sp.]|nr:hypothetical protein [Nitrospira sp.]